MMAARTLIGGAVGGIIGFVWYEFGAGAVLAVVLAGAIGLAVGWMLENPHRVIEQLQRLERD
ncbi:MAG: hypothetical protein RBS17_01830 [Coriobacteriia bacterium]|nr:hypothetical protein [Coriobacteriia bacterium]